MENNKGTMPLFLGLLVILIVGVFVVSQVVLRRQSGGPAVTSDAPSLTLSSDRATYAPGETITLTVLGDSRGAPVTGFDAVITLGSGLSFVSAVSAHADFDIYPTFRDNTLYITGVKKLSQAGQVTFDGVPLVTVTLTALSPGEAVLDLVFTQGQTNDSNLVDENTQDILGRVEGIALEIR